MTIAEKKTSIKVELSSILPASALQPEGQCEMFDAVLD